MRGIGWKERWLQERAGCRERGRRDGEQAGLGALCLSMGWLLRLLLPGSKRNTHLGVLVWNYISSMSTVKHGGSWTRNIPRMLKSNLCSEGITGKASMLLRSQGFQDENKPCMSKEGTTCFKLSRIHPSE